MMNSTGSLPLIDYSSGVFCFPVRHHSPACSHYLKQAAEKYSPDCILIEGPENADFLTQYLGTDGVVPPFAVYCGYDDKDGDVSDEKGRYRAYYPMLGYSPEYTAVKIACRRNIPVHFIDMPYALALVNGLSQSKSYHFSEDICDEYYRLAASKAGTRSFCEFWENGFEINGLGKSCDEFISSVIMLGRYMRELMPVSDYDACREAYMRKNIINYTRKYRRVLVVTGAYHISGLLSSDNNDLTLKKYSSDCSSVYLMPYTFEEMDSRSGYGAGIPFPAFYDGVYRRLEKNEIDPYGETVRDMIIKTAGYARSVRNISLPDMIQALYMANELAHLRGREQPGVFDLIDGVRSSFVKDAIDDTSVSELDFLYRIITGVKAGSISINDDKFSLIPPCVADFRSQCRKYRINIRSVLTHNVVLDIVKNVKHYEKSCFLHRMAYLETDFCKCDAGPDYINNKNTSLVREHWKVRYSVSVETILTDLSVFGASVSEICLNRLKSHFQSVINAESAGICLVESYVLGFSDTAHVFLTQISDIVRNDCDFISQCRFMVTLNRLLILQKLTLSKYPEWILSLLHISFCTAADRLVDIRCVNDDRTDEICRGLRLMYSVSSDFPDICEKDVLTKSIEEVLDCRDISAQIYGVCLSLYYRLSGINEEYFCDTVSEYIITAGSSDAADFISGIILTGRDIILKNNRVLKSLDEALQYMDNEKFLQVLPVLRRAFTAFLPSETMALSKQISQLYDTDPVQLIQGTQYSCDQIVSARLCDEKIYEVMKKWGMNVD
ncbi:MAG: DUF5682 family protein [Oscillospiraceae bacterium]|nr:DUF5682 family protein [Oscillospiraceae bacterium]